MSEIMIERVARAIFESGMSMHAPASWEKCNEGQRENVRRQARAAIGAVHTHLSETNRHYLDCQECAVWQDLGGRELEAQRDVMLSGSVTKTDVSPIGTHKKAAPPNE